MRHLALAVVLACMLSGTAWAGEIPTGDRTPPSGSTSVVTPGEIPTSDWTTPPLSGEIPSGDAPAPQASSTLLALLLTLISIGR